MEQHKLIGDSVSLTVVAASVVGWLPSIAAALSIIWTAIRIYETKTVQQFVRRHRADR